MILGRVGVVVLVVLLASTGCASLVPGRRARDAGGTPAAGAKPETAPAATASAANPATPTGGEPRRTILAADDSVADGIVAVVNNDVITLNELRETVIYLKLENREAEGDDTELARRVLDRLIDGRLQLQEAGRENVVVEEAELDDEVAERMKRLKATSNEEFDAMLKKQGLTMDALKKKLREQLLVSKVVRRKVAFRVSVTEQEVDRYLVQNRDKLETGLTYHARHILIPPQGEPTEAAWAAAKAEADAVYRRLQAGADFGETARAVSKDGTAQDGGDLGTLKRGELSQDIETVILALNPNHVSTPVKTEVAYHIFRLEAKETLDAEGLGRVRQQVRDILFREKYQARFDAWLLEIKQRAIIEVRI